MNILFVNNIFPLFANANSGASVRSMRIITALLKLGHVDVISFVDNEVSNLDNCGVIYSKMIYTKSAFNTRLDKLKIIFSHSNPYDVMPIDEERQIVIDSAVKEKHYDYIVTRYIDMACRCGLLKYGDRLIIDIDDDPESVVKMFGAKINSPMNRIFTTKFYSRYVGQAMRKILPAIHHAFCSEPNRAYPNTDFLPNISLFSTPLPDVNFSVVPQNILFIGRMDHLPNIDSLVYFLQEVFPKVLAKQPDTILRIVGKIDRPDLTQLCESVPNVVLCGFVENLEDEYQQCRCAVVPLRLGTGTSVKLIEAMSLNRAVVTTSVGKRGLHSAFVAGEDYLLADEPSLFASSIIELITDSAKNRQIAHNALSKITAYYSEKQFNEIVEKTFIKDEQ